MIIVILLFQLIFTKHTIYLDTLKVEQGSLLVDTNQTSFRSQTQQSLSNYYNYQYVGNIRIMASSQISTYKVIYDTGSSQIWLPALNCTTCHIEQSGIDCTSPNCEIFEEQITINYQIGSLRGSKAIGMFSFESIFIESSFIVVHDVHGMEGAIYEGIVGLSPNSNHSFVEWPISFYYNFPNSQKMSSITFGGIDETIFEGEINYFPAKSQWKIDVDSVFLNAENIGTNLEIMVDSGSSLLIFPKQQLHNIELEFKGCVWSDLMRCPCPTNDLSLFPVLKIQLGEKQLNLEPQFYVHNNQNDPICHILISSYPSYDDNLIILGTPFMRKYYSIFDKEEMRMGLVESEVENNLNNLIYNHTNLITIIVCVGSAILIIKLINKLIEYELAKSNNAKSLMV